HHSDIAAIDAAEAGNLAVGGRAISVVEARTRCAEKAGLDETVGIEQLVDPLACIELIAGAPAREPLRASHGESCAAPSIELAREHRMRLRLGGAGVCLRFLALHHRVCLAR